MLAAIAALAVARTPVALVAVAFVWGAGSGTNWVLCHAAMQRESPDEVIGRLAAFDELMVTLAMVLSAFAGAAAVAIAGTGAAALTGVGLGVVGLTAVAAVVTAASGPDERQATDVVALAQIDAVVAQDGVGGGDVEVEVG